MVRIFQRLKHYFISEFTPDKLKWERIVNDEKSGRGCPHCGRFGFYIHLPTSLREYWWGFYRCKGCKHEYRPKFTKGNLFFLLLLALIYFHYFGTRGFTYQTYIKIAVTFAFGLGANLIFSRMSRSPARMLSLSTILGWGLLGTQIVLAHHGEGVANGNPKDILYLTGSTIAFTLAGGSLMGLLPGVQTSLEEFLDFLLGDDSEPWVDPGLGNELVIDGETETRVEESEPGDSSPSETGEEMPADSGRPDWVDPEHERSQLEWWRTSLEDEQMRLDSYLRHRQDDPGFNERVADMRRSIEYYREKLNEQQGRMRQWDIDETPHRSLERWDPFAVSEIERQVHQEDVRRRQWQEAWNKFEKMRAGAEKRGHDLYGDPARWDKAMDTIFDENGDVDYEALDRARTVFQRSIQADIDKVEGDIGIMDQIMDPEHRHWSTDFAINTARDVKNNPVTRIGSAVLSGGKSEALFELLDQIERMHQYVEYHDKGGSDTDAIKGAFKWGVKEFAKDKTAWREIQTLRTGKVEMPNGQVRDAGKLDYVMSLLGVGLKGRDWHGTVFQGKYKNLEAFGFGSKTVEDVSGPEGQARPTGTGAGDGDAPRMTAADGDDARFRTDAVDSRGGLTAGNGGGGKPPNIPADLADDYKGLQQALANGDEGAANRFATRMAVKNYDEFNRLARNGTLDPDTVRRAQGLHQVIVAEGAAEGMDRTKKMGALFGDQLDADGNVVRPSPIKHVWAPGSALEPFDPKNPKMPGDMDLTTVVDKKACQVKGVDPDDIQKMSAGHMRDSINQIARQKLGDDIGDYCKQTKVKPFEPGSPEEYHAPTYHDTVKGRAINSRGDIVDNQTSLGEELWPGSKEVSQTIGQSKTGRAMVAADEHFQINKNIREFRSNSDPSEAQWVEAARDVSKHLKRSQNGAGWTSDDIDGSRLQLDEAGTPQQKLDKFKATVEAAQSGDPDKIKAAVQKNYNGDYDKFLEDMREGSKQMTRSRIETGGRIFDAQAERLQQTGVKVPEENIIKHSKTPPSSRQDHLQRMGVDEAEQKQIQARQRQVKWEKQADEMRKNIKPEFGDRELPTQADKGWPGGDKQPWPAKEGSIADGTLKPGEDWWPKKADGQDVENQYFPPDAETEQQRWINRDKQVGRVDPDGNNLNRAQLQGISRPPHLEKLAQENPTFKNLDDRIRGVWHSVGAGFPDKNAPHGPYAQFKNALREANVSDDQYRAWHNAVRDGKWEGQAPADSVHLGTSPGPHTQPGFAAPSAQSPSLAGPGQVAVPPSAGPAAATRNLAPVQQPQAAGPSAPPSAVSRPAAPPEAPPLPGEPQPAQPSMRPDVERPTATGTERPGLERPQSMRPAGREDLTPETETASMRSGEDLLVRERAVEEKMVQISAREEALAQREKEMLERLRKTKTDPFEE